MRILYPICTALALALGAGPFCSVNAQSDRPAPRQITVEQTPMAELQVPASDLKIEIWSNRGDGRYAIGETIQLYIRPNRDVSVAVLNIDAMGRTTVLFPNRFSPSNRLQGNTVRALPGPDATFQLRVSGPPGTNLIKVVATTREDPILKSEALSQSNGPFAAYERSTEELARQIQVESTAQTPDNQWALADLFVDVLATGQAAAPTGDGDFGLSLQLDKSQYRLGDELRLQIASERDCQLIVVNIDSRQQAVVLYPNRASSRVALKAGQMTWLPGADSSIKLSVLGPEGAQELVALCTTGQPPAVPMASIDSSRAVYPTLNSDQWQQLQSTPSTARTSVRYQVVR